MMVIKSLLDGTKSIKVANVQTYLEIIYISGALVSMSDYESTGPSLIPDEDNQHTAHPAVHPPKRDGQ